MVTSTTSPLEAIALPSNVGSLPVPPVKPPPCIHTMTALPLRVVFLPFGRSGVHILSARQSSVHAGLPIDPQPDCIHCGAYSSAVMLEPLKGVRYVECAKRAGIEAYLMPRKRNEEDSRRPINVALLVVVATCLVTLVAVFEHSNGNCVLQG